MKSGGSILRLQQPQQFKVIFYNDRPIPMPGDLPARPIRSKNEPPRVASSHRTRWHHGSARCAGLAISLRPDAVFLLSDGEYPPGTVEAVAKLNPRKTPIHCIDLSGGEAGDQLQRIPGDSGGRYASRPWCGED